MTKINYDKTHSEMAGFEGNSGDQDAGFRG